MIILDYPWIAKCDLEAEQDSWSLQNETCPSHCGQAKGSQRQTASKVCTPSISVTDCRRHASKTRQQDKPGRQTWKTFLEATPERQTWKTLVQDNPGRHSCKTLWEDALRRLSKNVRVTLLLTEAATFIFDVHPFSSQRRDWATAVSTSLQSWIRLCHCFRQRQRQFRQSKSALKSTFKIQENKFKMLIRDVVQAYANFRSIHGGCVRIQNTRSTVWSLLLDLNWFVSKDAKTHM